MESTLANTASTARRLRLLQAVVETNCVDGTHLTTVAVVMVDTTGDVTTFVDVNR